MTEGEIRSAPAQGPGAGEAAHGPTVRLGIAGTIAQRFYRSQITPLLALVGLLLGVFAALITPREEEPQIEVTLANVFIAYPGATAQEVESLVATPAGQVLSEIAGIKHVYSVSQPGMAVLTVEYEVGTPRTEAIVRLYDKVYSNEDWLPRGLGIAQPIIKPMGIDDVPIVAITLWTDDPGRSASDLLQVAHALETQLKRVKGTRQIYTTGGPERVVNVALDPERLARFGISLSDLESALRASNVSHDAGTWVAQDRALPVQAGSFLTTPEEVARLVVAMHDGAPVYLCDVAEIILGPDVPESSVWHGYGPASAHESTRLDQAHVPGRHPAVTLAVAKKPGENAVQIARRVVDRYEQLKGVYIPEGVHATLSRDYGATADDKAKTLIKKLFFATGVVVLLIAFTLGWREAIIVGLAVLITLALTLFASWAYGFTLNRVSLFALIFSIGILVDDAIVVVENIHRHMAMGDRDLVQAIPQAVDEVGGPTILATFTVIAALMPMAFVSGLMGPYMSPIPINASIGMLISLAIAFVVTPWLALRYLKQTPHMSHEGAGEHRLERWFRAVLQPMLRERRGAPLRWLLLLVILLLIGGSLAFGFSKTVVLKMLPFDNKSEFQVLVDLPEGASLERTQQVLQAMADEVARVPEVRDYQIYAGTAAPINFNGLVRQYYLRAGPNVGDIQVNLIDKHHRQRKSHEIALTLRPQLAAVADRFGAAVKVVEVPPGPPVFSPIVAEIYGLDHAGQIALAHRLRGVFEQTADIVDIDDSTDADTERLILHVDRSKAARLGLSQQDVAEALTTALRGLDASYLHGENLKYPVPVRLQFKDSLKGELESLLSLRLRSETGELVPLGEVARFERAPREQRILHKDLLPVVMVTGDMAGVTDSPLYGMFGMFFRLQDQAGELLGVEVQQRLLSAPDNPNAYSIKWDGEWQITFETFRDMGIAYGVGLLLIYLLVVAQFRSYVVPLIIMAPIPLTIIGVMPGHALLDVLFEGRTQFTATSMIGMIALAGIIVRNSILLVDFINESYRAGVAFETAVIRSAAVRTKPILLTAFSAMLGAVFILDDPIFNGLAISLIFGIFVSTVMTLVVIPMVYYAYMYPRLHLIADHAAQH